ncbi:MAG TPA: hypothetical protein VMD30_06960 [Tepidisphaeraceae bacterium]|nr:hypothetical protein [Tepidisphaeraceae bacterium]
MKLKRSIMVAAFAAVTGLAGVSMAVPVTSEVLTSGDIVGTSGWRVSFPVGIALIYDGGSSTAPDLVLQKSAAFQTDEGLDITFTQVSTSASPTITISTESVTNITGGSFSGFQFLLATDTSGTPASFAPGAAFDDTTPPFPTQTDTSNDITLSGGTLANTLTAKWGGSGGGALTIDSNVNSANYPRVFELKEIPIPGSVTVVPAPAAAWTGLSGLLGLGLIAGLRRMKWLTA